MLTIYNTSDLVSIMLGIMAFFMAWQGGIANNNYKIKITSLAILATSLLDLARLMTYTEIFALQINSPDYSWIAYWIAARLILACTFLYAICLPSCFFSGNCKIFIYTSLLLIGGIAVNAVFGGNNWPFINIDRYDHPFVYWSISIAIAFELITLYILRRNSANYVSRQYLQLALLFDIITNLCFIISIHSIIELSVPAHIFKIIAYYYVLRTIFDLVIRSPYEHLIKLKEQLENLASNNAKLYNESEKQRNLVEDILAKIGTIISSQLNLKDTLDAIADMVADMMHARQSLITILSNDQSTLQVVATYGINTPPKCLSISQSLCNQVIDEGKAQFISDLSSHPEIFRPQLIFSSINSSICAPLLNDGQIIGFIEAYSSDTNAFSQRDALLLTALGHHAGAAIVSAMLYEETKLRLEEETFLSKIAQAAAATIDTQTIMEQCTEHSVEALNADIGVGFLAVNTSGYYTTVSTVNFDYELSSFTLSVYPQLANIVNSLKPATAPAEIFPPMAELYDQNATRHIMVLPLAVDHNLLGIILLGWQRFITPERLKRISFAALMAQQIALGLEKAHLYNQIKSMALSDGLTGLANRRNFDMFLKTELRRAASLKRPLSLIMLDLDKFKMYNDTYGHLTGDKLLAQIGQILHHTVRSIDLPARYGGEEFSIILPECSSAEATAIAEKLRKTIEASQFPDNFGTFSARITASLGVSTYEPNLIQTAPDSEKIIAIADKALYQAKQTGRNRVLTTSVIE
ncbi:MAG: diguanylate cyclase [Veillonellales bacterium]